MSYVIRKSVYSNILFEDCVLNNLTKINRKNKHNLKKAVELVWANQYLEVAFKKDCWGSHGTKITSFVDGTSRLN